MKNFENLTKTHVNFKDSEICFSVDSRNYPKDVIFRACYVIIDKIYVFLDSPVKNKIVVYLKTKKKSTKQELEKLRDEFLNELLNASLRKIVSKKNQKIVEFVVGGAINAALAIPQGQLPDGKKNEDEDIKVIEKEIAALKKELEKETGEDFKEDPRQIRKLIK